MRSSLIIALEFASVVVLVLGVGGWELWRLRRDRVRDAKRDGVTPPESR